MYYYSLRYSIPAAKYLLLLSNQKERQQWEHTLRNAQLSSGPLGGSRLQQMEEYDYPLRPPSGGPGRVNRQSSLKTPTPKLLSHLSLPSCRVGSQVRTYVTPTIPCATPTILYVTPTIPCAIPTILCATPTIPCATPTILCATPTIPCATPTILYATPTIMTLILIQLIIQSHTHFPSYSYPQQLCPLVNYLLLLTTLVGVAV